MRNHHTEWRNGLRAAITREDVILLLAFSKNDIISPVTGSISRMHFERDIGGKPQWSALHWERIALLNIFSSSGLGVDLRNSKGKEIERTIGIVLKYGL